MSFSRKQEEMVRLLNQVRIFL